MKRLFFLIALAISINGSTKGADGVSDNKVRTVNVTAFHSLRTTSAVSILYTPQEGRPQVEIHAPEDAMPHIDVQVTPDSVLLVSIKPINNKKPNWKGKLEVHVKARPVHTFEASGAGDIILQGDLETRQPVHLVTHEAGDIIARTIRCKKLQIETASSGDVIVRNARCEEVSCLAHSAGGIIMKGLECTTLEMQSHSSGDIHIDHLSCEQLNADTQSSGGIQLSGSCRQAQLKAAGSGDIYASRLKADTIEALASASGAIECHPLHSLKAETSSNGEIQYTGNPENINTLGEHIIARHSSSPVAP